MYAVKIATWLYTESTDGQVVLGRTTGADAVTISVARAAGKRLCKSSAWPRGELGTPMDAWTKHE